MFNSSNSKSEDWQPDREPIELVASRRALAGTRILDTDDLLASLVGTSLPLPSLTLRRAAADMAGLWQRYHEPGVTRQLALRFGEQPALVWIEWLRIEALGARRLKGLRANTSRLFDYLLIHQDDWQCGNSDDLLDQLLPLRRSLEPLVCGLVYADKAGEVMLSEDDGRRLNLLISDQLAFAEAAVAALNMAGAGIAEGISANTSSADTCNLDIVSDETIDEQQAATDTEYDEQGIDAVSQPLPETNLGDCKGYQVFCSKYDCQVDAIEYARRQKAMFPDTQDEHRGLVSRLANRLQRRIQALQRRHWEHDLDEGRLDSGRLARVVVSPLTARPYKKEQESLFKETVVTLLVDNSGSMRGQSIAIAYHSCSVIAQSLERCGIKVEILGFTTAKHNQPLLAWQAAGRPEQPGRLNALRHIIYKPADCKYRRARGGMAMMLNTSWLQENIDGEALLWAYQRLLARREPRRILLVISDGKPMDLPTIKENGKQILEQHLHHVIKTIEQDRRVEFAAIGIGHDVARYYANAITIYHAGELGEVLLKQLERLFLR